MRGSGSQTSPIGGWRKYWRLPDAPQPQAIHRGDGQSPVGQRTETIDVHVTQRSIFAFDGETLAVGDELRIATFFDPDGNQLMLTQHR